MPFMLSSKSELNNRIRIDAICAASLDQFRNVRWTRLKVLLTCALLCWTRETQARSCEDLYNAVKSEAMYCGFFCDLEKLELSQKTYEVSCIRIVLPPSLFDLDSVPQESSPLAGRGDLTDRTAVLEGDVRLRR